MKLSEELILTILDNAIGGFKLMIDGEYAIRPTDYFTVEFFDPDLYIEVCEWQREITEQRVNFREYRVTIDFLKGIFPVEIGPVQTVPYYAFTATFRADLFEPHNELHTRFKKLRPVITKECHSIVDTLFGTGLAIPIPGRSILNFSTDPIYIMDVPVLEQTITLAPAAVSTGLSPDVIFMDTGVTIMDASCYDGNANMSATARVQHNGEWKPLDEITQEAKAALDAIRELCKYFTSGNPIPVERATILAKDFWSIVGKAGFTVEKDGVSK